MLAVAMTHATTLSMLAVASVKRQVVRNSPSMSVFMGIYIGMDFSCSAGFLLLTTALYIGSVAVMIRDRSFFQVRWLRIFFPLLVP